MPLSGLAQFLLGQQGFSEGQKIGTPGINPNAPDPRPTIPNSGISNFLSPLNNPFLLNILAQQGRMTIAPGTTASIPSPLGIIGKAALMTQQQQRQQQQFDLQERLIKSQIGLYDAKAAAEGVTGGAKAQTQLGKLYADRMANLIDDEEYNSERQRILREGTDNEFDQTQALRGEFRRDTDGIRQSQSALAAAKALVQNNNPIAATAAFTSFIRSIDNSVVRPAEQAAYSSAGGLARYIEDQLSKLQGQGPLGENTRKDLLASIETLEAQLEGIRSRTVDFYNKEAELSKLRPGSVTGIPSPESPKGTIPTSPASAPDDDPIAAIDAELAEINRQLEGK